MFYTCTSLIKSAISGAVKAISYTGCKLSSAALVVAGAISIALSKLGLTG